MRASSCVGRVGGLALALGVGTLVLIGGADTASAEPSDSSGSRGTASVAGSPSAADKPTTRSAGRGAGRAERESQTGPVRRLPASLAGTSGMEPERTVPTTAAKTRPAARAAAPSFGEVVQYTLFHRSATANPTQAPGQSTAGVVTGNLNAGTENGAAMIVTLTQSPARGSVTLGDGGSYTYIPDSSLAAVGGEDIFGVTIDNGAPYRLSGLGGAIQGIIAAIAQMIGLRQPDTVTAMVTVRIVGTQTPVDPVDPGPANPGPTDPDPTDPGPTDPVNTAPVAAAPTVGAPDPATGVVTGRINATDPDGDALTFTPAQPVTPKGAVSVTNSGTFTYLPSDTARQQAASATATDTDRTDTFVVSVADGRGGVIAVSVDVAVLPAATPPPAPPTPPVPPAPPTPPTPPTGRMAIGMNLENVVDWSPAWTFTDAFKASRPWISHSFNPQTWQTTWDPAAAPVLDLDEDGNVHSLATWTQNGVQMRQYAGTLMFNGLDGAYAAGTYHAQWDGTGVVTFGMDAVVTSTGVTPEGRHYAELAVTPTDSGIYLRIEQTDPADPVRDINVWMPDYAGQSFVGQRWQPGADFSPFHPLFLSRLSPFGTLRFMGMQETNTTDIVTWAHRRDADDIRQGSGPEGTPSEPVVNGISLEYMVELANELDADPWFNMPYAADDTFVRNFATYVRDHLEPGRTVYVEWANEVWNFGWGFEASQWVADQARTAGLDPAYGQWIVAGREAKRDMVIWSDVFAGQSGLELVRVAAGWAAVNWVTNQIAENMDGAFDAIAIAPYITPTDEQRAAYTAGTGVDRVLADTRTNIDASVQWVADHEQLTREWAARLGRPIDLLAYEGGAHLDGRGSAYQGAFYTAGVDPRMGDIYRDYLRALDEAGMDLYVDFQFTGQAGPAPWGDFAKLHRMDQSLSSAYRYNAVVAAADGSLWTVVV